MNGPRNSEAVPQPTPSFQNAITALAIQIRPQTALLFSSLTVAMLLPGSSFSTIKWVNEQSSVASHLLSSSRYVVAACKPPYQPKSPTGRNTSA